MRQEIIDLILETAKELGEDETGLTDNLSADTRLFGEGGVLDSMGLVTLVIAVEQAIEDKYDVSPGLADEKALSQKHSPYRTVSSLADYAQAQIKGA